MYPNQDQGMYPAEGDTQAPVGTAVPQKLLEEMLWFFRVEDASPWNISMLVLVGVVVVISIVLLGRNIKARSKVNSETRRLSSGAADMELLPLRPRQILWTVSCSHSGLPPPWPGSVPSVKPPQKENIWGSYWKEVWILNARSRRKQKKLPPAKQTPEALAETRTKDDNSVNIVRETLLSEKPDVAREEIELRD
ncbi:organic solute transporter subunit beta isoform X1 [Phyllostomus hastatus]|uniref:organic solute transporter subunit beta isoform X1 n=1 Tax=Phyllostomus hastatus TaxID=9423 RepID=UPI001E681E6F|nr:organic solute transporter subunit beta isoform X1 [Phyllostomus hastatus]